MVRLAEWPRNPYLNEELHEWVRLHLESLGVEDIAVFAVAGREDDERRILVVTEVGLLDGWYAPRGSTARFSLNVRLYPWQAVSGVDLRGETYRLWAHEHQSRWRLRLARPVLDALAETPELGQALTQFAAACSVMAEPSGHEAPAEGPAATRPPMRPTREEPAFAAPPAAEQDANGQSPAAPATEAAARPGAPSAPPSRPPIRVEPDLVGEPGPEPEDMVVDAAAAADEADEADERSLDLARRLGLR
jgi:hypothetical protein